MKNLIIILSVWFTVVSCTQPAPDTSAFDEGVAKFEKNKAIADATFNLFENGDLETFMNNYADDLVWSPPNTNDSLSMEAFAEGMKGWHADFENFKFKDCYGKIKN